MSTPASEPGGSTEPTRPPRSQQERVDRARMRTVAAVVVGLLVGAVSSFGQTHLAGALRPLTNSASAWLVAPFVLGALMRTRRGAVAAGAGCALAQLAGYCATTALRGLAIGGPLVTFWAVCAVVGGPLFGGSGHLARRGPPGRRGLGGAAMAAAFLAEGLWADFHELHADASGWVWIAIGLAICAVLLPSVQRVRWLALTLPLGVAGDVVLTQIYR